MWVEGHHREIIARVGGGTRQREMVVAMTASGEEAGRVAGDQDGGWLSHSFIR